jgi:hypothetical protein
MALTPEQQAKEDAKAAKAAKEALKAQEAALPILERILKTRKQISDLQEKGTDLTTAQSDELYKQETKLAKLVSIQEKRLKKSQGTKQSELELASVYASQVSELSSISKVYKGLTNVQKQSLTTVQSSLSAVQKSLLADENKKTLLDSTLTGITELQGLQQKIAEAGPEDVETQNAIGAAYRAQLRNLKQNIVNKLSIGEITKAEAKALLTALGTQKDSLAAAEKYGTINAETKELIEGQIQAYEGIKKSIRGVIGTAKLLFSGWQGFARVTLMGAGAAITKLGKTTREFGGFLGTASVSATVLGTVFDDAGDVAKGLAEELGGMEKATFGAQLNTNLMALNMGISGAEAAKLTGAFARMNGGSVETAQNLAAGTKEMAKTAGVVPSKVMADLAGSAEEFALYGKDGGKNLAQAAVQAAKMGVSLKTMTGVADNLLDFENSINSELELGAMLGKNINLDRARALAYEGDIAGATQETLNALGGVEAFNQMDYFQKKKTAELMGVSVEELQKMVTAQTEAATIGGQISGAFNTVSEGLTAITTGPLGNFVTGLSGAIGTTQEIAGNFKSAGGFLSDMGGKLKGMFGAKPPIPTPDASMTGPLTKDGLPDKRFKANRLPTTPATPPAPTTMAPQTQAGPADQANKMSKIKSGDLIKGAVALLILAAALFVAAKAFQEFGDVTWESVGMGLVALAGLAGIAFILSKASGAMLQGALAVAVLGAALIPFAFAMSLIENLKIDAVLAAAAGLVMFGLAAAGIGMILPLILAGSVGIAALGVAMIAFGTGLMLVSGGMGAISAVIPFVTEQISALSQIDFLPILGLAGALTILSIALAAVAATGMLALPALLALGLVAGGAAAVMGGGEGEGGGDRTGELIDEIKGLRADLIAGKIAVNIDGQKVTSNVGKVVARNSSNSYAKV